MYGNKTNMGCLIVHDGMKQDILVKLSHTKTQVEVLK